MRKAQHTEEVAQGPRGISGNEEIRYLVHLMPKAMVFILYLIHDSK